MGCDSPDSNFNNLIWDKGQWWYTSGWDYSVEGPWHALAEKFPHIQEPSFTHNGWYYSLTQIEEDRWIAVPTERESNRMIKERQQRLAEMVDGVDPMEYWR